MRMVIGFFTSLFVLVAAFGCGDALDLGNSGSRNNVDECTFQYSPNTQCAACNAPGDACGRTMTDLPRQQTCCCGAPTTGSPGNWQCFYNSEGCPSSPPKLGESCQLPDGTCQYCGDSGAVVYTCANAYWQGGQLRTGC